MIGTHLAVDESIQRFMGRASEIVNIPSKPTPEGFKIWILANAGYVLDWLYQGDRLGPIDLDDFWTDNPRFSKTQAVVLDLVTQQGITWWFSTYRVARQSVYILASTPTIKASRLWSSWYYTYIKDD